MKKLISGIAFLIAHPIKTMKYARMVIKVLKRASMVTKTTKDDKAVKFLEDVLDDLEETKTPISLSRQPHETSLNVGPLGIKYDPVDNKTGISVFGFRLVTI